MAKEHDDQNLPVAFLSHMFWHIQCKWSTPEQDIYGVYHAVMK